MCDLLKSDFDERLEIFKEFLGENKTITPEQKNN
jgi:hypothetical protein